jgi:hypothetical protein
MTAGAVRIERVFRGAYTVLVRIRRELRGVQVVLLMVVALSLLLLLLMPHAAGHAGFVLVCLTLVPVFLFGSVVIAVVDSAVAVDASLSAAPVRAVLFQRPPPFFQS